MASRRFTHPLLVSPCLEQAIYLGSQNGGLPEELGLPTWLEVASLSSIIRSKKELSPTYCSVKDAQNHGQLLPILGEKSTSKQNTAASHTTPLIRENGWNHFHQ